MPSRRQQVKSVLIFFVDVMILPDMEEKIPLWRSKNLEEEIPGPGASFGQELSVGRVKQEQGNISRHIPGLAARLKGSNAGHAKSDGDNAVRGGHIDLRLVTMPAAFYARGGQTVAA